ncbi:MAG: YncE family protein, partial [Nitrospinota bacterium]
MALSPDGKLLYVVNTDANRLSVIDTEKGRQVKSVLVVGRRPSDITIGTGGATLWVA